MRTILAAVALANKAVGLPEIIHATTNEVGKFIDTIKATDGPSHIVLPFEEQGTWEGANRHAIVPFEGWILTTLREEGIDLRTPVAEANYISPMRLLVKKYFRQLVETDIVDDQIKTIKDNIAPEFGAYAQKLLGVHYKIWLPILEGVC